MESVERLLVRDFETVIKYSRSKNSYEHLCEDGYFIYRSFGREPENPAHHGVYAVNCVFDGRETFYLNNGTYEIDHTRYLLLNANSNRSSSIQGNRCVESFSVNFSSTFVHACVQSLADDQKILDNHNTPDKQFEFFEGFYEHNLEVSPFLFRIRFLIDQGESMRMAFDEEASFLLEALVLKHFNEVRRLQFSHFRKSHAQRELLQRLLRSRDYIFSCFREEITIAKLAGIACLNSHYFLREFKKKFGITPHSLIQQLRLKEIAHQLKVTNKLFIEICHEAGYSDPVSLRRLFKTTYGSNPSEYRITKL